jgi:MoaA/NifB/PqqE/SkfB family radical SAM enzyme
MPKACWQFHISRTNAALRGKPNSCRVAFSIQAVATRENPRALEEVAKFAAESNARVMQVMPFEPVRRPITHFSNEDLLLSAETAQGLPALITRLQREYPNVVFELFEKLGSGSRDAFHCDIGQTKMFFLPDGVVHRCYKLIHDDSLRGPDLRRTSVAAAWHDRGFGSVITPPRIKYAAGSCGSCSRFATCHDEGRCIYQALIDHGKYEDRDRKCEGPFSAQLATMQ